MSYELRALPEGHKLRQSIHPGREYAYAIFDQNGRCVYRVEEFGLMFLTETLRNLNAPSFLRAA